MQPPSEISNRVKLERKRVRLTKSRKVDTPSPTGGVFIKTGTKHTLCRVVECTKRRYTSNVTISVGVSCEPISHHVQYFFVSIL